MVFPASKSTCSHTTMVAKVCHQWHYVLWCTNFSCCLMPEPTFTLRVHFIFFFSGARLNSGVDSCYAQYRISLHVGLASCQCTNFMKNVPKYFHSFIQAYYSHPFSTIEHVEISKLEEDIFKKKTIYFSCAFYLTWKLPWP